ncbi:myosin heavy chain, embryonic smooth muscle isoform-like isoform X2 [Hoplias malabaricus]|uniref:myosin heavy chain, embryonic smooth muscle isoform-like isoform X2 n=1 Tax=Hoplias malabaricus TaxID=27720 RepID=UPI003462C4D5
MLGEDVQRYRQENTRLDLLNEKLTNGMPGNSHLDSSMDFQFDREKLPDRPPSDDEPVTPRLPPNPKYQLFLGARNGTSGPGGPMGTGANGNLKKSKFSITRRSMESLVPRDWDSNSDKMESPPRVFNSPYSTVSIEYSPTNRMSDYKIPEMVSPSASEINLFGLNRSLSPASSPTMQSPRTRFSTYDTLTRRRDQTPSSQLLMRNNLPNKRDYIEEMTKQLENSQRRNQFLEAESIELEKERTQIRFEMRGLLVNNEDLLRMNTQLQGDLKRMRERLVELESDNNVMVERFKQMEVELKEAREVMVEANTQEYAFNFLQQSLKNKLQDAEEALEKQAQHTQSVSEKLWLAERNQEELELEKDSRGKKIQELNTTVQKLEAELSEALQQATQATTELSLQQKLRMDAQLRVEELEEGILEKDQEMLRLQQIVNRLQGEVSDKLLDKELSLEQEIQLREKLQLQCKQAERAVEDLQMELQTATQARDDLAKQVKQAQENLIDLETDLEEMQENEQRWASKHKKALEQCEQLQLKLIQEKDLSDKLECEKVILERQIRELNGTIEELENNRVHEHVVSKAESRAKDLENALRDEERSKLALKNTIIKLEKRVNELTEQLDEEQRSSNEQKDLMTQRMRSLKRQLSEAEEQASRRESQYRHTQRALTEERETIDHLQKQVLDLQLQMKRKDTMKMRQTLDNFKLDISVDEDDELDPAEPSSALT